MLKEQHNALLHWVVHAKLGLIYHSHSALSSNAIPCGYGSAGEEYSTSESQIHFQVTLVCPTATNISLALAT